jgi:hypothetical protein
MKKKMDKILTDLSSFIMNEVQKSLESEKTRKEINKAKKKICDLTYNSNLTQEETDNYRETILALETLQEEIKRKIELPFKINKNLK